MDDQLDRPDWQFQMMLSHDEVPSPNHDVGDRPIVEKEPDDISPNLDTGLEKMFCTGGIAMISSRKHIEFYTK